MVRAANEELVRSILEKGFVSREELVSTPALLGPPADVSAGRPFGKYVLLRKIGEGGFGRVFLAIDPLLQRRVALKLLKGGTPDDVARFAREARMAAELRHPNIVPVHEVGQVGRDSYIALEYIEGAPLAPSGLDRDLRTALKVARALGAAHARGMIHRDVKPQNILVDAAGEPFLTDFGLARHVGGGGSLTQTGSLVGTPGFMSPEQARGELRLLGPASDVFSLGATLYFLCTRRAPFEGETELEVIRKVIETEPRPPRSVDPRVPREIEAIVLKAMAKDAARRYATAVELADDLERYLERRPVFAARRKLLLPAASVALALVAAALLFWPRGQAPPAPPPPPAATARPKPVPPAVARENPPEPPTPVPEPAPDPRPKPAPDPPPREPEGRAIDPALRERLRKRVLDQPEYYVRAFLGDADARRAKTLLAADRVSEEDLRFLQERVEGEAAGGIEREKEFLAASVAAREPDPRRVDSPDVIQFKGRRLEVRVLEVSDAAVKYVYKGQTVSHPRSEVESVSRGAAPAVQFHAKLESARDLAALAEWCRENRLDLHREYVLYRILASDPANAAARRDLGLPLTGPLKHPAAAERVGEGYVYEGKAYTAAALRQALLDKGYRVVDGRWCSAREWRWAPREYWKTKALAIGGIGVSIQIREEVRLESAYDLDLKKLVEVRRVVPGFHFIGPAPGEGPRLKGTAVLEVEAPGPILDCRILASASVLEGRGSVVLSVSAEGRAPVRLYALASGSHRKAVDAGEALRGARKFSLVAELESDAAAPSAFFLPGDAKDPEPLSIEGRVAEPQPQLDKLIPAK